MTAMPVYMKFNCIPTLSTRSWKFVLGYALIAGVVAIANNALISLAAQVFPVPFTQFAPTVPMATAGVLLNRFFLQKPETKERAEQIDRWIALDMVPICVYPIFTAVFMALNPSQQLWLSFLLPIIKRLLRHIIWLALRDDFDLVGPTTCSVAHLYHVLFTAVCLQNAKSVETLAAVIMVNVFQMLFNCRYILKDAHNLKRDYSQLPDISITHVDNVVSTVLDLTQQNQLAKLLHQMSPSRMFSRYPGYQSRKFVTKYHKLLQNKESALNRNASQNNEVLKPTIRRDNRHRSLVNAKSLSKQTKQTTPPIQQELMQILPLTAYEDGRLSDLPKVNAGDMIRARTVPSIQPKRDPAQQNETFVRSVTFALHQTEVILLRSYITIFMLSFYGIYLILVCWLPNRQYFATMSTMSTFTAVDSKIFHLLLLASIEVIFLGMYLVLISHQLGVSGVRQLAFILWSQRVLLQSKFMSLSLMILGFPLDHYGNGIIYKVRGGE
ncbi:Hypothetical protein PHPALM_9995 [Phytophthora palmivora]|uniref:Transmembrane protein n=1 Tax=Phytophthora palmivora TaxID=4796 RepID=A0A2P4Y5U4_9STRA|nr:Hypothetical protein PHPALM_9995 [Phytophthora palmivora]